MTEAQALELVSQRFLDRWPIEAPGVPGYLDGETQPSADSFACCSVQYFEGGSRQMTMGQHPRIERRGRIWIKLWTPDVDGGRAKAATLADAARKVFERVRLTLSPTDEGLICEAGSSSTTATDGRWFMSAVTVPFRFYEQQ